MMGDMGGPKESNLMIKSMKPIIQKVLCDNKGNPVANANMPLHHSVVETPLKNDANVNNSKCEIDT
jgi:hypothetical protein